jgi:hypothetical protein
VIQLVASLSASWISTIGVDFKVVYVQKGTSSYTKLQASDILQRFPPNDS